MPESTTDSDLSLGDVIRHFRGKKGYSARELSLRAGLSESYIGKVEKGEVINPTLRAFAKIAEVLGLNAREVHTLVVREAQRPVS